MKTSLKPQGLDPWYSVGVLFLFFAMSWVSLQSVIVAFPGHTHLRLCYIKTILALGHEHNTVLTSSAIPIYFLSNKSRL